MVVLGPHAVCPQSSPIDRSWHALHHTQRAKMHILRHSSSTATTTSPPLPLSSSPRPLPPLSSPPPPPPPQTSPKPQALRLFRTFSTRSAPTNETCGSNAWETSPRVAARALRGWFGSPPSPSSGKAEGQEEYKWRYLEDGKEWEGFLRSVEDEGGCVTPPPRSPVSLRRVGEGDKERQKRSDSKSSNWDAAMLAHARSLGYSCSSSPSEFGSNGSAESLASGSSGGSSTHTSSMSLFSPSIRTASYYHPMRRRCSSYSDGGRGSKRPIASEDFVAQYFAESTEGSMLEGLRSKPKVVDMRTRRNEARSPEQQQQQNALQLEVETRPRQATETISPGVTEPTFVGAITPVSKTTSTASPSVVEPSSLSLRSPRDVVPVLRPPSPAPRRARSPTPHRTFRPSPLGPRTLSSANHEDDEQCEGPPTDLDTLRVWKSKRRRNTTEGLTTIWEMGSHRECVLNSVGVQVRSEAESRNIDA